MGQEDYKQYREAIEKIRKLKSELAQKDKVLCHDVELIADYEEEIAEKQSQLDTMHKLLDKAQAELARYKTALKKIAEYMLPKGQLKTRDVTLNNMADLSHCIQDMAGLAKRALE